MNNKEDCVLIPIAIFEKVEERQIEAKDAGIYSMLLLFSSKDRPVYLGTVDSLAAILSIPRKSCRASIRNLEKNGFIQVSRKKNQCFIEICTDIGHPFRCSKFRPSIPVRIREKVLSRGSCVQCGSTSNLTVDHVVPYSRGGAHDISNFQCLCAKCNRKKWCN